MKEGFRIAGMLDALSDICLHADSKNAAASIRYTPEDVMNASIIFIHIINNVAIHRMMDKNEEMEKCLEQHKKSAHALRRWIKRTAGVDTAKYYSPNSK